MPRKQYLYHYIYKTTCSITGRFYVGMHSTSVLEDDYLGSGKRLWLSIRKHGKETHSREILEFLPDRKSLKNREKEIVTEQFINNENCMNLMTGGHGGWGTAKQILKEKLQDSSFREHFGNQIAKGNSGKPRNNSHLAKMWKGRKMSQEQKDSIGKANSTKTGEKNSMFGKIWVYDNSIRISKPIDKKDLANFLIDGWQIGRKKF